MNCAIEEDTRLVVTKVLELSPTTLELGMADQRIVPRAVGCRLPVSKPQLGRPGSFWSRRRPQSPV